MDEINSLDQEEEDIAYRIKEIEKLESLPADSQKIKDDLAIEHLNLYYDLINVHCKRLRTFGELKPNLRISNPLDETDNSIW